MEERAVEWTEWVIHRIFFWESDSEKKGRITRAAHHAISYFLLTMILVSHTIYPAFWLQTLMLFVCGLIWVHHIVTHGCVLSKVEQKLIGDNGSFVDPFLDLFGVEASERSKQGILMMGSTLGMFMLTLEWLARIRHYSVPVLRQAMTLVASSVPSIPLPTSSP